MQQTQSARLIANFDRDMVARSWDLFFRQGETVELRFFPSRGTCVGYFRDKHNFIDWAERANVNSSVYVCAHAVPAELYEHGPQEHWRPFNRAVKDHEISVCRVLLIDLWLNLKISYYFLHFPKNIHEIFGLARCPCSCFGA